LVLVLALEATKKGLLSFVQQMGMTVLSELLATEAAPIAGPKGKHIEGRTHHHWGTATTPVGFGGRQVSLQIAIEIVSETLGPSSTAQRGPSL
jgi:hypothetical protein